MVAKSAELLFWYYSENFWKWFMVAKSAELL
jgi:hypothetical protein